MAVKKTYKHNCHDGEVHDGVSLLLGFGINAED